MADPLIYINDIDQEDFALLLSALRTMQTYWESDGVMRAQIDNEYADRKVEMIDSLRTRLSASWTRQ